MEFEEIKKIILQVKPSVEDKITPDANLIEDLQLDSIEIFQVIMGFEEKFNIQIQNEELQNIKTINDIVEKIKNAKK